jgi:hypothetical protein
MAKRPQYFAQQNARRKIRVLFIAGKSTRQTTQTGGNPLNSYAGLQAGRPAADKVQRCINMLA